MNSFSGGNKRRLSLGIALVGLPDVLCHYIQTL